MPRTLTALAALLLMTAPAHAGSVLGGSTLRVSSSSADSPTRAELEGEDLLSTVLARFQMVVDVTTGKPHSTPDGSTYNRNDCSEDQAAANDENADDDAKTAEANGPRPIIFAF